MHSVLFTEGKSEENCRLKNGGNANFVMFGRQTKEKESSTWLSISMG